MGCCCNVAGCLRECSSECLSTSLPVAITYRATPAAPAQRRRRPLCWAGSWGQAVCVWVCVCGCASVDEHINVLMRCLCVHTRRCGRKSLGAAWCTVGSPRLGRSHAPSMFAVHMMAQVLLLGEKACTCLSFPPNCELCNQHHCPELAGQVVATNRQSSGTAGLAAQHRASLPTSLLFASATPPPRTDANAYATKATCNLSAPLHLEPDPLTPTLPQHRRNLGKHRALTNTVRGHAPPHETRSACVQS